MQGPALDMCAAHSRLLDMHLSHSADRTEQRSARDITHVEHMAASWQAEPSAGRKLRRWEVCAAGWAAWLASEMGRSDTGMVASGSPSGLAHVVPSAPSSPTESTPESPWPNPYPSSTVAVLRVRPGLSRTPKAP